MTSTVPRAERDSILWEVTRSLCPECRLVIDAQIHLRGGKVVMRKRCPYHGSFEALVFGDSDLYTRIQGHNKPGTVPLRFQTEVKEGCPLDCGLCPEHQQHTCLALIEVNSACNLDCPLCFANSGTHLARTGFQLTYEQVDTMLDTFVAAEGDPEVIQFSGGEPTLHPQLLDFIALAQRKGIPYVMVNTNGIRIAHDDELLEGIARLRPHIYLQFDGFDERTNATLRGRPDLIETKLRALDRLAEHDVRVVLVAAIERDVNLHEVGRIVDFGLAHPAVFGVNFQPAFRAQRHLPADPLDRVTIPDVLRALEEQTEHRFALDDFVPVPCCMPTCNFVTYALVDGESTTPITRILDIDSYLDYLKNRTLPRVSDDLLAILERLWSSSAPVGSDRAAADVHRAVDIGGERTTAAERCTACRAQVPLSQHTPRDVARHVFMINTRDFMDPWTFNVKNVMKCCVEFLVPDGRMIPFCAYNSVGYREEVAKTLTQRSAAPRAVHTARRR